MDRLPDNARIANFVDGLIKALRELPQSARAEFGAEGQAVQLKAARALSKTEKQTLCDSISAELDRKVTLAVTVDPDLIAGLEIETPHAAVRNSFRDDLGRIAAELIRSDDRQA
jgi:F-type H+-transporting ATPase subunit b